MSFNPRSRGGSDSRLRGGCCATVTFQSTLPRGERLIDSREGAKEACFNPRSRGGSDAGKRSHEGGDESVSIHAPAGGATRAAVDAGFVKIVSIHAPAGGATSPPHELSPSPARFNPRSRGGSDALRAAAAESGAGFNPRSRGGSDDGEALRLAAQELFQSTLPRGERLSLLYPGWTGRRFQSTLPRGERRDF